MTTTIGIDPGARSGAIAFIMDDVVHVDWLPFVPSGKAVYLNTQALLQIIRQQIGEQKVTVYIERQQAMPKQGVSSTFKTGFAFGAIVTFFQALGYPVEIIEARKWKADAGLLKQDKDKSRARAMLLYPEVWLPLKKDHNKADALLIAHFGSSSLKLRE